MICDIPAVSVSAFPGPTERYILTSAAKVEVRQRPFRTSWAETYSEIENMIFLADDWDGQEASAPAAEMILSATEFARVHHRKGWPAPTRVAPSPDGTIVFEWQTGGNYYTIELVSPCMAAWVQVDGEGNTTHGEIVRC